MQTPHSSNPTCPGLPSAVPDARPNPSTALPLVSQPPRAMAAKGLVQAVSKGLMRASAARSGGPNLCAPTSAVRSYSTARAALPSLGQPLRSSPFGNDFVSGARLMSTWKWDDNIPLWMYGSIHDPEVVFHRLSAEDKEMARLLQLMINGSMGKVLQHNGRGVELIMLKLEKVSTGQKNLQGGFHFLLWLMGAGAGCVYHEYHKRKSQMIKLSSNLASHSPEIFSDLVEAGKDSGPSIFGWRPFGKGKPLKFNFEWLEEKKDTDVKDDCPGK